MRWIEKARIIVCGFVLVAFPAGCKSRETKRTTVEIRGPESERKLTIESSKTKDDDDD